MSEKTSQTRPKPRIESLSDLIFGLALSVGAITLVGNLPATIGALINDIATYGFSFLILISVWMRYTRMMSVLPLENRRTIFLNTTLLFTVSLEPFLFNVLKLSQIPAEQSSIVYGADLGTMLVILGCFVVMLADEERALIPKDLIREFKIDSLFMFLAGGIFFVSLLPIFWVKGVGNLYVRFDLWLIPILTAAVRRRVKTTVDSVRKMRNDSDKV